MVQGIPEALCVGGPRVLQRRADSFLDATYLSDRLTTIREYLAQHPDILLEPPPPELLGRYSG